LLRLRLGLSGRLCNCLLFAAAAPNDDNEDDEEDKTTDCATNRATYYVFRAVK
jgi:hypothetical protein